MARVRRSHCTPSRPKVCMAKGGGGCQAPWAPMQWQGMATMYTMSPGSWTGSSQTQQGRDHTEAQAGRWSLHEQNANRFGGSSAPCARPQACTATRSRRRTQRARCSGIRGAMLAAPQIRRGQCRHAVCFEAAANWGQAGPAVSPPCRPLLPCGPNPAEQSTQACPHKHVPSSPVPHPISCRLVPFLSTSTARKEKIGVTSCGVERRAALDTLSIPTAHSASGA